MLEKEIIDLVKDEMSKIKKMSSIEFKQEITENNSYNDDINYYNLNKKSISTILFDIDRGNAIYKISQLLLDLVKAIDIEKSILDFTLYYVSYDLSGNIVLIDSVYSDKVNDICANIDPNSSIKNTELKKMILNESINLNEIGYMTPDELFPSNWKEIYDKLALRRDKIQNTATTNAYKCKRCGKRECTVKQEQTRSSDEPPTTFIICKLCKIITYKF